MIIDTDQDLWAAEDDMEYKGLLNPQAADAAPAPQAAGVIHTDFEKGFIKADIVSYDDFVAADGSMVTIKEEGKLRQEGRDYVMQDGDIVEFKFNVSKWRFPPSGNGLFPTVLSFPTVGNEPFLNALGMAVSATSRAAVAIA